MNDSTNQQPSRDPNQRIGKGMIFLSVIAGLGLLTLLFDDVIENRTNPNQHIQSVQQHNGTVEVVLQRNHYGHYIANGNINYQAVTYMLDTGATDVAIPLSMEDELELSRGAKVRISTANGISSGYRTRLDVVQLGDITLYDVPAILTPNLDGILLGMSFLKHLDFTQQGNQLILTQRQY